MKRLALLLFLLFMCIVINAGRYSEGHRLYLRDGSVITCTTVEYADEGRLRVVMTDGNEIIIDLSDVVKTERIKPISSRYYENVSTGLKGFTNCTLGVGDIVYSSVGVTVGYQFSTRFFLGIGANYGISDATTYRSSYDYDDVYMSYDDGGKYIPIYGCTRFNIMDNRITPFVDIKIGADAGGKTHFYSSYNIGCRLKRRIIALCPSLGCDFRKVKHYEGRGITSIKTAIAIAIGFAVEF